MSQIITAGKIPSAGEMSTPGPTAHVKRGQKGPEQFCKKITGHPNGPVGIATQGTRNLGVRTFLWVARSKARKQPNKHQEGPVFCEQNGG